MSRRWARPVFLAAAAVVVASCMLTAATAAPSSSSSLAEALDWKELPGRPIESHMAEGITFTRIISQRERTTRQETSSLRSTTSKDHSAVGSYIVKVRQEKRRHVLKGIRSMYPEFTSEYLPHDSYVVVVPGRIAEEIADLEGVHAVLELPPKLKLSPELLDHMYGDTEGVSKRRKPEVMEHVPGKQLKRKVEEEFDHMQRRSLRKTASELQDAELSVSVGRKKHSGAESFAGKWAQGLRSVGLSHALVDVCDRGAGPVVVKLSGGGEELSKVAEWLSGQGDVLWVERKVEMTVWKVESRQGGIAAASLRNAHSVPRLLGDPDAEGAPLLWRKGLRGAGQVIAVGDTGLDFDNCAFGGGSGDDAALFPVCEGFANCSTPSRHRKIFSYRTWENATFADDYDGHGTHVAGSAAANTVDADAPFQMQGAAPEAKIAVEDGGNGGSGLVFPDNLYAMFQPSAEAGVRIHSDSWGYVNDTRYNTAAQLVDWQMWLNDEYLVVFAAGNSGAQGYRSVSSPATSKNAIAVGAAENVDEGYPLGAKSGYMVIETPPPLRGLYAEIKFGVFGSALEEAGLLRTPMAVTRSNETLGKPDEACTPILNAEEVAGKIALIRRGSCAFQRKCHHAELAGAVACIVMDHTHQLALLTMAATPDEGPVTIPSMFVSRAGGDAFQRLVGELGAALTVTLPIYETFDPANVADFSSRGPTTDLRFKPDIVAIGDSVYSAKSDADTASAQCSAETAASFKSGTSMAAPQISGAAALVRQYFEEGFHVSGARDLARGYRPSGALVKTVILHAGQRMAFPKAPSWSTDKHLFPNFDQGYGQLQLSSTLWFGADSAHNAAFYDRQEISENEQWQLCLSGVGPDLPLKVTLHWTDPPASTSAYRVLVHNLDLDVSHLESGAVRFGNAVPAVDHSGAPVGVPDATNNNEQITWASPGGGQYRVHVTARDLPLGVQNFSLVVSGRFAAAAKCPAAPPQCPKDCSGHGVCVSGQCQCEPTHAGADCASANLVMASGVDYTSPAVAVTGWVHYAFPVTADQAWVLNVTSLDDSLRSDPDFYLAYNRPPSLSDFDAFDVSPGSVTSFQVTSDDARPGAVNSDSGYWVVGMHAHCCNVARVMLRVTIFDPPGASSARETSTDGSTTTSAAATSAFPTTTPMPATTPTGRAGTTSTDTTTTAAAHAETTTAEAAGPATTTPAPEECSGERDEERFPGCCCDPTCSRYNRKGRLRRCCVAGKRHRKGHTCSASPGASDAAFELADDEEDDEEEDEEEFMTQAADGRDGTEVVGDASPLPGTSSDSDSGGSPSGSGSGSATGSGFVEDSPTVTAVDVAPTRWYKFRAGSDFLVNHGTDGADFPMEIEGAYPPGSVGAAAACAGIDLEGCVTTEFTARAVISGLDAAAYAEGWTACAWAKLSAQPHTFMQWGGSWLSTLSYLGYAEAHGGYFYPTTADASWAATSQLHCPASPQAVVDQWRHICWVVDTSESAASDHVLYLDGTRADAPYRFSNSAPPSVEVDGGLRSLEFGSAAWKTLQFGDIRLYNQPLTDPQVCRVSGNAECAPAPGAF